MGCCWLTIFAVRFALRQLRYRSWYLKIPCTSLFYFKASLLIAAPLNIFDRFISPDCCHSCSLSALTTRHKFLAFSSAWSLPFIKAPYRASRFLKVIFISISSCMLRLVKKRSISSLLTVYVVCSKKKGLYSPLIKY